MAQQLYRDVPKEKVYYVGGFSADKDIIVTAKGKSFHVPPVGEYLEVESYIADTLIQRNRNPKAGGMSVFTKDRRFAQAVKNGEFKNPVLRSTIEEEKQWTREELLAKLAEIDGAEPTEQAKEAVRAAKKAAKVEETE